VKKNLQIGILVAVLSAGVAQAQQNTTRDLGSGYGSGYGASSSSDTRIYREGGGWVEEISGSLAASRALKVKTDMGNVRVQGGAQTITFRFKMRVNTGSEESARRRLEAFRFSATRQGDTAVIIGDCRGDCPRNTSTEFMVEVPSDTAQVLLQSGGGNLTVSGLNGEVSAGTGGGNLRLDGLGGPVSASSGGGSVEVGSVRSTLAVSTGGGNIHIGMAGGPLSVSTGGGEVVVETANSTVSVSTGGNDIHIGKVAGALTANTGGGNIQIGDVGGAVIAETGGGDIRLSSARGQVRANTGGGNLQLWGVGGGIKTETGAGSVTVELVGGQPFTPSEVETGSGDIIVYIPSNMKVTVRAAVEYCNGGGITSDFAELKVRSEGGQYGHEVYADGSLNGGGPLLKIRAGNGSITIHRGKK
jgi:DUF4097 and DUF4098 domain-containing protein YvlB